jgi:hypothetical protein
LTPRAEVLSPKPWKVKIPSYPISHIRSDLHIILSKITTSRTQGNLFPMAILFENLEILTIVTREQKKKKENYSTEQCLILFFSMQTHLFL